MVSLTIAVPNELKEEMNQHPEFNWSEVARQAIMNKLLLLKRIDKLLEKSKLTEEDAIILGKKVNKGIAKWHKQQVK